MLTRAQQSTLDAITPEGTSSVTVEGEATDGSIIVRYDSTFGPYGETLGRYRILPGGTYRRC